MNHTWTFEREYDLPDGRRGWFGNRSDGAAFHDYSKPAFDGYLDADCNCSLTQRDKAARPIHKGI